jgi:serine/threonine-protein kinase
VLSQGPQPRVVPDLTGLTPDQATATLAQQGLVLLQLEPEFSDSVAAGLIIRQDLPVNSQVDPGAVISVVISKGQDLVAVPPLANLTVQQATDTLAAAGLTIGAVTGNVDGVLVAAKYQGVDVLPAQLLPRGSAIDVAFF